MNIFKIRNNEHNRREWVKNKLLEIEKDKLILDVGCGTQQYRNFMKHLKYFAQDFAQYSPGGDGNTLQIDDWEYGKIDYVGNCWDIDAEDAIFDVILCTEVLEHIPYPNETIEECSRLLCNGGIMLLTVPFASMPHMTPYYFYSGFYKEWFYEIGKEHGLEVIEISENGNIFEHAGQSLYQSTNYINDKILRNSVKFFFKVTIIPLLNLLSYKVNLKENIMPFGYHVVFRKNRV